ncbi:SMARCAD1 [Mytilus edulis]|uniref:SMARCAD1 n=1 Tax=Mytilus edulis TaxID=6550 RepID=A0A8S3V984_MYTED|nr:SMARCAD1 [Mytilus edulis]
MNFKTPIIFYLSIHLLATYLGAESILPKEETFTNNKSYEENIPTQSSKVSPDTNITVNKPNTKSVKKVYSKTSKYPCGSCNGAVTWKTAAVCCDSCEKWYHKECIGMSTLVYQGLNNAQWECDQCGLPNYSTCLFDTSIVMNTNTSHFDSSTNSSFCIGNIGSPSAASSPIQKTSKQPYNQTRNKSSEPPDLKSDDISEQLWVKVQITGSPDLYIGSFYKPPNKTEEEYLSHLGKSISRIKRSENCHLWLGGDFNLGGIDWNNYSIKQKAYNSKQCQQLIDLCQDNYLEQVVTKPTHYTETSQSTLDLFFTNNSSLVNKTEVIPGISDHEIVYIESNLKPRRAKKPPRKVFLYNKANTEQIKEKLNDIHLNNITNLENLTMDELWDNFKTKVLKTMEESIPTKMINNTKQKLPWINKEIKSLIRKRNKLFKKMKTDSHSKINKQYRETKKLLQKETRKAYWTYLENIICYDESLQTSQKQKKFWNYIRSTKKDSSGVAPLRSEGKMSGNPKLNTLLQYRFIKKPVNKIQSDNSDEGSENSQENQPSDTVDTCSSTPTLNGNSQTTVPETPEIPTSPSSPVFQQKSKLIKKNVIESDEEVESSGDWLSKDQGIMTNGNGCQSTKSASKRKQKLDVRNELNESSDDEELDGGQTDKVRQIKDMFPQASTKDAVAVLRIKLWNTEDAVDIFMSGRVQETLNPPMKKKRVIRFNSSDSEQSAPPRKKCRRVESSDSEDMDSQSTVSYSQTADSQATLEYNIDSQQTIPGSQDQKEQIKFLVEAYPEKSKKYLRKLLSKHNWSIEAATEKLEQVAKRSTDDYADALDDEDDNYDSDECVDSEDSIDEEDTGQRAVILAFFDDASLEQLSTMPGVSKRKAEIIEGLKPFKTWDKLVKSFTTTKGLSYDVIHGCNEIIRVRNVVIKLMEKCEKISKNMESIVSYLTNKQEIEDSDNDDIQIKKQPGNLNPSYQLKPFQMVGLNWLRIMHTQHLNGILADEMGLGKTIQTIAFLAHLLEEGERGPHVIIVPSSTIDNWLRELHTWCPDLKPLIYYGSMDDRRSAERRLLLTGTPLQNNLLELMSLLSFVMPEIFSGKTEHLKKIFSMITRAGDDKSKYSAERIAQAKRIMKPFLLRRLKSEVQKQLPKKSEELIRCEMTPEQKISYDQTVKTFAQRLKEEGNDMLKGGGASILMQLRKIANHPLLLRNHFSDDKLRKMSKIIAKEPSHIDRGALPQLIYEDLQVMHDFEIMNLIDHYKSYLGQFQLDQSVIGASGKFIKLKQLLHDQKEKGEKVLIFSQFTMLMDIMEKFLKQEKYKYLRLDGQTPVTERGQVSELDRQAEDRCHRVGQTREVSIIRLISKDTVEEAMLRCAQEKLKLEKDITTDEGSESGSSKDVASLLRQALADSSV